MKWSGLPRLWGSVVAGCIFIRFHLLGFTVLLPLLGAASVAPGLAGPPVWELAGVGLAYHIFAYVLNDVVDLPLDRTEPRRAASPLVRGTIRHDQGLSIALLQVPITLALTIGLAGDWRTYGTLAASLVLMATYNVWGKRLTVPLVADTVQGVGWGALVLYGALAAAGTASRVTGLVFAIVLIFIVMINGVHASLRDLTNDFERGMRTTTIMLGVRPDGANALRIPLHFIVYIVMLQALLTGLIMLPLLGNWLALAPGPWTITTGAVVLLNLMSWLMLLALRRRVADHQRLHLIMIIHASIWLSMLVTLVVLHVDRALLRTLLVVHLGGLLLGSMGTRGDLGKEPGV